MTTLIAVYTSEGCIGRCDAKCYGAHSPHCDCVCGGANHGVGMARAMENTQAAAEQWLDAYAQAHDLQDYRGEVDPAVYQLTMTF